MEASVLSALLLCVVGGLREASPAQPVSCIFASLPDIKVVFGLFRFSLPCPLLFAVSCCFKISRGGAESKEEVEKVIVNLGTAM